MALPVIPLVVGAIVGGGAVATVGNGIKNSGEGVEAIGQGVENTTDGFSKLVIAGAIAYAIFRIVKK